MKLFRLNYKGLSSTPAGEGRERLNSFFVESLIEYLNVENISVSNELAKGLMPELSYGEHGKPYFKSFELANIFFSISHTKDFAGVAFAKSEVGFDCENMSTRNYSEDRIRKIANRVFCSDEIEYVFSEIERFEERFFEIWTAKEAYSKYTGTGFSEEFRSFSVMEKMNEIDNSVQEKNKPVSIITRKFEETDIMYSLCAENKELQNNG